MASAFALLYLLALGLLGLSALGLSPRPLAGVFILVLGLPWTLGAAWFPDDMQPFVAALAPTINWFILGMFCASLRLPRL